MQQKEAENHLKMPPKKRSQKATSDEDYSKLTVAQLKALCKKRGLDAVGKKQQLLDMLKNDDADIGGKKVWQLF